MPIIVIDNIISSMVIDVIIVRAEITFQIFKLFQCTLSNSI